jgi:predicted DNA-binding transcriptional regulator AlpA
MNPIVQYPSDYDNGKLTEKQVAHLLQVSRTTLWAWRTAKVGPPYHREVYRIFYYRSELEAWRESTKWA